MLEHGSFEFEVVEQTLVVKCFDAWNVETVLRMCSEYKDHVKKINDKPWACLVDLTQWELVSSESQLPDEKNEHAYTFNIFERKEGKVSQEEKKD